MQVYIGQSHNQKYFLFYFYYPKVFAEPVLQLFKYTFKSYLFIFLVFTEDMGIYVPTETEQEK